jgi:glycosyltransferase involved in cell wall biosynthesis
MMPRYPVKIVKVCQKTPLTIGPVNGGVPFPKGFQTVARQEFAYLNFFRSIGRALIPGYRETYQNAAQVLAGSTYTLNLLKKFFNLPEAKLRLFYENGIPADFVNSDRWVEKESEDTIVKLLFVGRLVPYKGCDMLIQAIAQLPETIRQQIQLTIVGDGSERENLEKQVQDLNLVEQISFTGWVKQQDTLNYYQQSDLFCFPSVREFGGAVVLEAMACGLPCLVVNNGGIGEYVTEATGFKIEPISREHVIQELAEKISLLVQQDSLRQQMSLESLQRAKEFTWPNKGRQILEIYRQVLEKSTPSIENDCHD